MINRNPLWKQENLIGVQRRLSRSLNACGLMPRMDAATFCTPFERRIASDIKHSVAMRKLGRLESPSNGF